ncbi:PepSY-associated TM helix domain-containing protein [Falsirhodobacter deserti]|uniref:PepSY-associated TM helix domain-containing protein n=1 Tax=Falsirhodobacter deserti TaxID=1365611 RepID=UPI000FE31B01|nr:PepSY-associated TM helix domain-containing protein [Falsirhodobacter deserti]
MSTTTDLPRRKASGGALRPFLLRLHFYIGLFVGPFLFIAALTGLLYVLTPQIEARLYSEALFTDTVGPAQPLSLQAQAARDHIGGTLDVSAVRPAPAEGQTTRIMFSDPALGPSENRTLFVDPVTLAIKGDMTTYGTSGILPFRITLDYLHRSLLLGDWGRYYSELAASWLWVVVLGGVALWTTGAPRTARRRIHGLIGVTAAVFLLFLSVTGLTWSQGAGGRIDALRGAIGWTTPSVSTTLNGGEAMAMHHHHHAPDLAAREDRIDQLDDAARAAGLGSPFIEIRLPRPHEAWVVREYDRGWPTQAVTVALAPDTLAITDRADFADFTPVAKLIRWGIDTHMGVLFGLPNQILMATVALALMASTAWGYAIWWARRPAMGLPLAVLWMRLSLPLRVTTLLIACAFGWALPTLGTSLAAFLVIDILRLTATRRLALK